MNKDYLLVSVCYCLINDNNIFSFYYDRWSNIHIYIYIACMYMYYTHVSAFKISISK